ILEHLRSEAYDFTVAEVTQFTRNRTKDAGCTWLLVVTDNYGSIVVKFDSRAILATNHVLGADNDSFDNALFLNVTARVGFLNSSNNDVTNSGIAAACPAKHTDAQDFFGTTIVANDQARFLLNHA